MKKEQNCANCSHPEWLHAEPEIVEVHCSAYAEMPVDDCDCPGFKSETTTNPSTCDACEEEARGEGVQYNHTCKKGFSDSNPSTDWREEFDRKCPPAIWRKDHLEGDEISISPDAAEFIRDRENLKTFIESLLSRKEDEVRKEVVRYIRSNTVNAWSCTTGSIVEVDKKVLEEAEKPLK